MKVIVIAGLVVVGFFAFVYWMLRSCVAALSDDIHDVVDWHYSDYQHDIDEVSGISEIARGPSINAIDGVDGHTPDMLRGPNGTEAE